MKTLLLITDQSKIRKAYENVILSLGDIQITATKKRDEAEAIVERETFDLICLDYDMVDGSGPEILKSVRYSDMNEITPVLLLTHNEEEAQDAIFYDGKIDFLKKPIAAQFLADAIVRNIEPPAPKEIFLCAGESFIHEGEISENLYWLKEGVLNVVKVQDEKSIVIGKIKSGEIVGEMSFLDGKPRSATVIADTDCKILEIQGRDIQAMMGSLPQWYQRLVKTLVTRLRSSNDNIMQFITLLVSKHEVVDEADAGGKTLLMKCAEAGHIDILISLLKKGLDPEVKDKNGHTALDYAIKNGHHDIAKLLKKSDAA